MKKLVVGGWLVAAGLCGTAWAAPAVGPVEYLDWDASASNLVSKTCTDYKILDAQTAAELNYTLSSHWYVVTGRVELARREITIGSVTENAGLIVKGDAHLILVDDVADLSVTNGLQYGTGIQVEADEVGWKTYVTNSLAIYGQKKNTGRLTSVGGPRYNYDVACTAGIGCGNFGRQSGAITINGGTVTAIGGYAAAGIGCGDEGSASPITINGGVVSATGAAVARDYEAGAGIGGSCQSSGSVVTINGGDVTAIGGEEAAGIGGGLESGYDRVTVNGGKVKAFGGYQAAGIGTGYDGYGLSVTINDGEVIADGGEFGSCIGTGARASFGAITINGGHVRAVTEAGCVGIGRSNSLNSTPFEVTIAGGEVTAIGSSSPYYERTGASGLEAGIASSHLNISGGTVTAIGGSTSDSGSAGIKGTFSLSGGHVTAIGGGDENTPGYGIEGDVTMSGGDLFAKAPRPDSRCIRGSLRGYADAETLYGSTANALTYWTFPSERNAPDALTQSQLVYVMKTVSLTVPQDDRYNPVVLFSNCQVQGQDGVFHVIPGSDVSVYFVPGKNWSLPPSAVNPLATNIVEDMVLPMDVVPAFVEGKPPVPYMAWNDVLYFPEERTCVDYEELFFQDRLANGKWYVVDGTTPPRSYTLPVNGSAHLILRDDTELVVRGLPGEAGIAVSAGASYSDSLTIYGQAGGTGRLTVTGGTDGGAGIGGGNKGNGGTVTINGGIVAATGVKGGAGIGGGSNGKGGTVTVHGGEVTATGSADGGAGIGGGSNGKGGTVTVHGGEVTATGCAEGGAGVGGSFDNPGSFALGQRTTATISAGADVVEAREVRAEDFGTKGDLDWSTNAYVRISASAEPIPWGADVRPWQILDENGNPTGWTCFTNGCNEALFSGEGTVPGGFAGRPPLKDLLPGFSKIFVPVGTREAFKTELPGCVDNIFEAVEYTVWNEHEMSCAVMTCAVYSVVTPDTVTLGSGWYVVEDAVTNRTGGVRVDGDAHLILRNGAEFVVTGGVGRPGIELTADGPVTNSLAVHGQAGCTGRLTAIGGEGADGIGTGASGTAEPGVFTMDCPYRWVYAGTDADGAGAVRVRPEELSTWHANRFAQIRNEPISYLDWDGGKMTNAFARTYAVVNAKMEALKSGWYVVEGTVSNATGGITVTGDAHLILADDAEFVANGINVNGSRRLTIYGQERDSGRLTSIGGTQRAGICVSSAHVTINGGIIVAAGGKSCAGIGGSNYNGGGDVTINGGSVTATGGINGGAGIGGGCNGNGGTVTINGGVIAATGGISGGAGIGGGNGGNGGTVTVHGGDVTAIGGENADGIGRGRDSSGSVGTFTLNYPSGRIRVGEDASGAETTEVLSTGFGDWHGNGYVHIAPEAVEYVVWNETAGTFAVQTCSVYTVVLPSTSVLSSGWYVVSAGVTNATHGIRVDGDVNLILCDGVDFYVKGATYLAGIELTADGSVTNSLAVHGQVGGTGVLTAIGQYGADGIGLGKSSESKPGVLTVDGSYMRVCSGKNESGAGAVRVRPEDLAIWHTNGFVQIKQSPVSYLDWDGGKMTNAQVTTYSVLNPEMAVLKSGWYVVDGAVTNATGGITASGDVHIVLSDGAELVVDGITVDGTGGPLALYGQEKGTGRLTTTGGAGVAGIGTSGQVTINGGIIAATGGAGAAGIGGGNHGDGGTVTVHGGEVTAVGGEGADGIGAGAGSGNFGGFGLDYPNGIIFAGMDPSGADAVVVRKDAFPTWHVNRYVHIQWVEPGSEHNPWPVLDGSGNPTAWAAYTDENGMVCFVGSGLLPVGFAEKEPFCTVLPNARKILVPGEYLERFREALPESCLDKIIGSVEYFGWNEAEMRLVAATCTVYEVVTPDTATLGSGWFVVDGAVTNRTGGITVEDDAHLILVDDAELVVNGITANWKALTVYGQSRNTGVLTAIGGANRAGIGGFGMSVTINGGVIAATGGTGGAGIGGDTKGSGCTVTVHGGDVTAIGGEGADGIGAGGQAGLPGSFAMNYPEAEIYVGMAPDAVEAVARAEEFSVWHTNRHVRITTVELIAKGSERNPWAVGEAGHEDELLAYTNGVGQLTVTGTGLPKPFDAGEEPWADVEPTVETVFVPRDRGSVFRVAWPGMADRIYDGRESTDYYAWNGSAVAGPLVADALTVIPETATLTSGWYVVKGAVTNATGGVTVRGDVHLILADGAEFVVIAEAGRPAVELVTDEAGARSSLAVYGQAEGSGRILADAESSDGCAGIGSGVYASFNGRLDVHGGQVEVRGGASAAGVGGGHWGCSCLPSEDWLEGFDVNVFGGRVLAAGGDYGAGIGCGADSQYPRCAVTVLGGEVLASGGIVAGAIGWGSSSVVKDPYVSCAIELGDGLMLWAGDEDEAGDFSGLGVVPLEKYLESPRAFVRIGPAALVEYQEWDETESRFVAATCTDYTSVMPNMGTLESGWYVVDRTVTNMTDGIRVDGDVHLILVDGAKLVASGVWGDAGVCVRSDYGGTSSLVIYGQAGGTGALEATGGAEGGAGIGGNAGGACGVVTINGGTVMATGGVAGGTGIGGGRDGNGGTVTVCGGSVTAIGGEEADGIGGGALVESYYSTYPGTFTLENPNAHVFAGMNVDGTEVEEVAPEDFYVSEDQSGWHAKRHVQISTKMMPTVKVVSAKSVRPEGLWTGTAEVVGELSGLDDAKSYALALELTAAGRFGAVTNNLGAQKEGVCENLIDGMALFGALVQDPAAELTLKLIEIDGLEQVVSTAVKVFPFGNYARLTVPGVRHAWYELCTNGVPVASERLSDDTFVLLADAVPVTVAYTPTPGYLFASGADGWTKTYSADDLKDEEVTLRKDEVVAGIGDIVTGPVEYFVWNESEERLVAETCSVYTVVTPETGTLGNGWYVVNEEVLNTTGGIVVDGDAHLILLDKVARLAVTGATYQAGIEVAVVEGVTNSLAVYGQRNGTGRIEACPGPNDHMAAAIGGSVGNPNCGQVRIDGGSVTCGCGGYGAGIGGGAAGAGGAVTINGGHVDVLTGNGYGAGIGNGGMAPGGADVTINGGEVVVRAQSDEIMGAGIGNGAMAAEGVDVTINGGKVEVDLRYDNEGGYGAAIGGAYDGVGGTITINGGDVKAFCDLGAAIGNGPLGASGAEVTISGGTVLAGGACFYFDGVCGGAGIGGGAAAPGADVRITGGEVTAIACPAYNDDEDCFIWSSGIGAGYCPESMRGDLAEIYAMGTLAIDYPNVYVYSGMDTNGIAVAEIDDAAATYGSLQNPGWCTNCYVKITPYILGSERNPWLVPDENGNPTGWSAHTNGTDDVIFSGSGPLPDGFGAKPPFDTVLPKAPTIHVPKGTKGLFKEKIPEYREKITDGSGDEPDEPPAPAASDWVKLQEALTNDAAASLTCAAFEHAYADGTNFVKLLKDVTADTEVDTCLVIASGSRAVLDLNGQTLDRGLSSLEDEGGMQFGHVISVFGELTVTDKSKTNEGRITGGYGVECGGVAVGGSRKEDGTDVVARFVLEGGAIVGNKSSTDDDAGFGGVLVNNGEFLMRGGRIAENLGLLGGGVGPDFTDEKDNSKAFLLGGEIVDNTGMLAGGVLSMFTELTIGGSVVIRDNKKLDDPTQSGSLVVANVEGFSFAKPVISATEPLSADADVRVNVLGDGFAWGAIKEPVEIIETSTADDAQYFHSEIAGTRVFFKDDALWIVGASAAEGSPEKPWDVGMAGNGQPSAYTNGTGTVIVKGDGEPKTFASGEEPWAGAPITEIIVPRGRGDDFKAAWPSLADLIKEVPNYLAFTARNGAVTIGMSMLWGTLPRPWLETATDPMGPWTTFTAGETTISLAADETIYFRRSAPTPTDRINGLNGGDPHWSFTMTPQSEGATVAASGNIMSLLDQTCASDTVGEMAFTCLFWGCAALTDAPELPATNLGESCYDSMFLQCAALTNAPVLPATNLAPCCYGGMFIGCSSLTTAPELPATTLESRCYASLFSQCETLNSISVGFTNWDNGVDPTFYWADGVAAEGVFTCPIELPVKTGAEYIPVGWVVKKRFTLPTGLGTGSYVVSNLTDGVELEPVGSEPGGTIYEVTVDKTIQISLTPEEGYVVHGENPLTLDNLSEGINFDAVVPVAERDYLRFTAKGGPVKISMDGLIIEPFETATNPTGQWTPFTMNETVIELATEQTVYFRRSEPESIMSLNGEDHHTHFVMKSDNEGATVEAGGNVMSLVDKTCQSLAVGDRAFAELFSLCDLLTTAPKLPATTLASDCYSGMFFWCVSLTNAPTLPAMTLAKNCYKDMFMNCEALASAPTLPATVLAEGCYQAMFVDCTSLPIAPTLSAMTLAESCYSGMFMRCTALTDAPALPATILTNYCYQQMFAGCTALTNASALSAEILADACYDEMFCRCSALTDAPALLATALAKSCYWGMFLECTSLTNAPALPAKALVEGCCGCMFEKCAYIDFVSVDFTNWNFGATASWLTEVSPTGTFECPIELPVIKGDSYIPEGWVVKKRFTLPAALPTCSYVVTNALGEVVEPIGTTMGGRTYEVPVNGDDDAISIYVKPIEGYVPVGENPLVVNLSKGGEIGTLPTAEIPAAPATVKIVSAKSARTEGAWSGAAEVVYELSNLKADGRYALAFELAAAGQFGARTNEVEAVVDGVYTQALNRIEFFGIESQVQDPAAELTLKLIEKSKAAK